MPRSISFLAPVLLVAVLASSARAHDPYEITAEAWLRRNRVTLQMTLALSTAMSTCGAAGKSNGAFDEATFAKIKPALEICARSAFTISAGEEKLVPSSVEVGLTVEYDIEYKLVYPRPEKGPVRFDAALLRLLDDPNFGTVLTVLTEGAFLGQQVLRADDSVMEVPLPPPAEPTPENKP